MYAAKVGKLFFRDQTGTRQIAIDPSSTLVNIHVFACGTRARCYYVSGLTAEVDVSNAPKVVYLKNETQQWDQYTKTQMDSESNQVAVETQKQSQSEEESEENDDEDIADVGGVGSIREAKVYIHDCQPDPLNWWHLVLRQYALFLLLDESVH